MKRIAVIVVMLLVGFCIRLVVAQNTTLPALSCLPVDYEGAATDMSRIASQLNDPTQDPAMTLFLLEAYLESFRGKCTGGIFDQTSHPTGIVGPIALERPIYQLDFMSEAMSSSVSITAISGDCGLLLPISLVAPGEATNLLSVGEDCVVIFEVNSETDWKMTLSDLGATNDAISPIPESTAFVLPTVPPTATPAPVVVAVTYYVVNAANLRPCPNLTDQCAPIVQLTSGTPVSVIGQIEGELFQGSTTWNIIQYNDQTVYTHSTLLSPSPPSAAVQPAAAVQPVQPVQAVQPVQPSTGQTWNCSVDLYNCGDFATCQDMASYWSACPGDPSRLDSDHNGFYCESTCNGS